MRIPLFLFLSISPILCSAQWKYKTKYRHAIFLEYHSLSNKGISINYNPILYQHSRGFLSSSVGVAFISGIKGDMYNQSGVGIPLTLTYNYSLGDLDKRIKKRVTRQCLTQPSRLDLEWFGEGGVGFSPAFFKKISNEQNYSGYLGLRVHLHISRPYKKSDMVLFLRSGYSPFYRIYVNPDNSKTRGFRFKPHESGALGGSLGISI